MAKLTLSKKISLADVLGEGHENDFVRFTPLTFNDAKQLGSFGASGDDSQQLEQADKAIEFIKTKFVGGQITDEASNQPVELTASDFDDLPMAVLNHVMRELSGAQTEGFTQG